MSNLKYWYIDDEDGSPEQSTIMILAEYGVTVEKLCLEGITDFGKLKNCIIELASANDFAGLIVDLRLDGSNGKTSTEFNATALAQELRSISSIGRNVTSIYPIILTSTEEKINNTYINDKTSHDLFDYKMFKYSDSIDWKKRAMKLNSLSEGYRKIDDVLPIDRNDFDAKKALETCLNICFEDIQNKLISEKLLEVFAQEDKHYVVDFILKQIFHYSNPLINQRILFAKIGVYIDSVDKKDRDIIFSFFDKAEYTGVFCSGWKRWWKYNVEKTLNTTFDVRFSSLSASKRVELLNEKLKTNLKPSKIIKHNFSEEFSTICEATKLPLDHLEGFKIKTSHNYLSWQTPKYISLFAILDGRYEKIEYHISEKDRVEEEKKALAGKE